MTRKIVSTSALYANKMQQTNYTLAIGMGAICEDMATYDGYWEVLPDCREVKTISPR